MKSVRIQLDCDNVLLVDITCSCGRNGLKDKRSGEASFKHVVKTGAYEHDEVLVCDCGKEFRIRPQTNHIHISNA